MRDNTLLINHAYGYVQMLLSFSEGMATLEFFTLNPNDLPNPHKPKQTFTNTADAWKAVGLQVGWLEAEKPLENITLVPAPRLLACAYSENT